MNVAGPTMCNFTFPISFFFTLVCTQVHHALPAACHSFRFSSNGIPSFAPAAHAPAAPSSMQLTHLRVGVVLRPRSPRSSTRGRRSGRRRDRAVRRRRPSCLAPCAPRVVTGRSPRAGASEWWRRAPQTRRSLAERRPATIRVSRRGLATGLSNDVREVGRVQVIKFHSSPLSLPIRWRFNDYGGSFHSLHMNLLLFR